MRVRLRFYDFGKLKYYQFDTNGKMTYGINILGFNLALDLD